MRCSNARDATTDTCTHRNTVCKSMRFDARRNAKFPLLLTLGLLTSALLASCSGDTPGDSRRSLSAADSPSGFGSSTGHAARDVFPIPLEYQFAGISEVARADSTLTMLLQYGDIEQTQLSDFYGAWASVLGEESTLGPLEFGNDRQLLWLVGNGFPMPEDALTARSIHDDDLELMARAGNVKAIAFYLMRRHGGDSATDRGEQFTSGLVQQLCQASPALGGWILSHRAIAAGRLDEARRALTIASTQGDSRADHAVDEIVERDAVVGRDATPPSPLIRICQNAATQLPQKPPQLRNFPAAR